MYLQEYTFTEENPMSEIGNPLERGQQFLSEGDFPSAVLCFEAAVKKEPENALAWQLLGTTQAENEQVRVLIEQNITLTIIHCDRKILQELVYSYQEICKKNDLLF